MKRIIKLTESDITRIVRRVISEQPNVDLSMDEECSDTICYQYDYNNDTCVHVKDMKSKKLMDMWYDEKTESEKYDWFFDLVIDDKDVREYYYTLREDKGSSWGRNNDIFFFRRLAVEYCKGDNSNDGKMSQSGMNSLLKYVKSNNCGGNSDNPSA